MRLTAFSLLALAIAVPAVAAQEKSVVNPESLKRVTHDITYLASDALEGRGVQTKGIAVAADYIRDEFKKIGLKSGTDDGTYFQKFDVAIREAGVTASGSLAVKIGDETAELEMGEDFQPQQLGGNGSAKADIVFIGYGVSAPKLEYDDYTGADVKGKILLMLRREPNDKRFKEIIKDEGEYSSHAYIATKLSQARKAGAAGVLFVNDRVTAAEGDELSPPAAFGSGRADSRVPFAHISREQADKLLKASPVKGGDAELSDLDSIEAYIEKEYKPVTQTMADCSAEMSTAFKSKTVKAWNVIGVLEGEGPHAEESVVVGAHYDHLGFGGYGSRKRGSKEVHNGADDNATGTAAVLELARRFTAMDKKPARRMIFIGFSGEERGLVGSQYYVNNPTVPLKSMAAMLNFDMIGNLRNNSANLGGTGTGTGLQEVAEAAAAAVPVDVRISPSTGGGSDHLRFAMKGVPVLFCNTGLTELYHTPEDDAETLNMEGAVKVVDFCVELLKGVVSLEEKPKFQTMRSRRTNRRRGYMGFRSAPDSSEAGGLVVQEVTKDSPAEKGGLKVGDVITRLADKEIKSLQDVLELLGKKRSGNEIEVQVKRDGETVKFKVTLGRPPR